MMLHIRMPQRGAKGGSHMENVVITNWGHMFFVRILGLHTISIISLHQEPIMHEVRSLPTNTSDLYEACTHLICCNDGVSTNCLC